MIVAVVGTLNPSSGDVSLFLPTEQAALAHTASGSGPDDGLRLVQPGRLARRRARRAVERRARRARVPPRRVAGRRRARRLRLLRRLRGRIGRHLSETVAGAGGPSAAPSRASRWPSLATIVLRLAALFSLDSFGGGFVVQSLLVLWLYQPLPARRRHHRGRVPRRGNAERVFAGPLAAPGGPRGLDPDDGLHPPARRTCS